MNETERAYTKALQNYFQAIDVLFKTDARLEIANERIAELEAKLKELQPAAETISKKERK